MLVMLSWLGGYFASSTYFFPGVVLISYNMVDFISGNAKVALGEIMASGVSVK